MQTRSSRRKGKANSKRGQGNSSLQRRVGRVKDETVKILPDHQEEAELQPQRREEEQVGARAIHRAICRCPPAQPGEQMIKLSSRGCRMAGGQGLGPIRADLEVPG